MRKALSSTGVAMLALLAGAAVAALLSPGPLSAAEPKLQDLIERHSPGPGRVVMDVVQTGTAEWKEVGFKIGGTRYKNDFNDERWRNECFAYQGMGQLDGKHLDFVYGGDDVIVFCFSAPEVRHGGRLRFTVLDGARPLSLEISVSDKNENYRRLASISRLGTLEVDLPPSPGNELYLMLDGRRGQGVVVDDLVVEFHATAPAPTPTPTPTPQPEARDDRPGYGAPQPGTTHGSRVQPGSDRSGVTRGQEDRTGVVRPNR